MHSYLNILRRLVEEGVDKQPTRNDFGLSEPVEDGTLCLPNVHLSHNMEEGFPLLTVRRMPIKSVAAELYCFIHGETSKNKFKKAGCNYWNEWARKDGVDPTLPWEQRKKIMTEMDDLGPIYGAQWTGGLTDQLTDILYKLKNSPYDRRMICSAWNPVDFPKMALIPCHVLWGVNVIGDTLNLHFTQRSCDYLRGFNLSLYGLLLLLLAEYGGFKPGNLSALYIDCHIYKRDLEAAREMLGREPRPLPKLSLTTSNFWDWLPTDFILENYNPLPPIKMENVVV